MSHTFTFHFSRGADGRPCIMAIIDLEAECATCGYMEIQRFYHGLAFHTLTLPRFKERIQASPELLAYDCSNCGDPVRPEHVQRGAWTFGFADGRGLVQAFFTSHRGQALDVVYVLDRRGTFDPQALPIWNRDDADRNTFADLNDDLMLDHMGRVFTVKQAWRSLWNDFVAEGDLVMDEVSPDCWLVIGETVDETLSWAQGELEQQGRTAGFVAVPLHTPPTREIPRVGVYTDWLQAEAVAAVTSGQCCALAMMDPKAALQRLKATLKRARLTVEELDPEDASNIPALHVTTPRGDSFSSKIHVSDVLARAAYTGMTPGDAARLIAEEVVGRLMGLDI
ncbi:MAG: hypothetical protein AAFX99_26695 [Myxococcota bacterium]